MNRSSGSGRSGATSGTLGPYNQLELPLQIVASAKIVQFRRATSEPAVSQQASDALRRILQYAEKLPK